MTNAKIYLFLYHLGFSVKNILFVMPVLGRTGADRVIFTLLNNIDRARFKPFLLLYKNDPEINTLVKDLCSDVTVHYLNIQGRARSSFPKIISGISRFTKSNAIDTILISSGTSNAVLSPFLFLFGRKVKKIARETNLPSLFEKSRIANILYKTTYNNYDAIIAQSDDMFNDLVNNLGIDKQKIVKINNPLDYRSIVKLSVDENLSNLYDKSKTNLLSIGRLTYQKGFDLLLKAVSMLDDDRFHLTIIGDGEDKDELIALRRQLNLETRVTFVSGVDNPYPYMRQADVFVSSSRWEGYPNVVIESLLCGTPVLANNYPGGIAEIINDHNGMICDIENEFVSSLLKVVEIRNVDFDTAKIDSIFEKYNQILS